MQSNWKQHFPIFEKEPARNASRNDAGGPDLVYLDSAATALKPREVIQAMVEYYTEYSANVARGLYPIAEKTTQKVESVREKVARFIEATPEEIIFIGNTTGGINLIANGLKDSFEKEKNIVVSEAEHHSNFLPWKELVRSQGGELRLAPVNAQGELSSGSIASLVDKNTMLVAFSAVSNVIGLVNPVEEIVKAVRKKNLTTLILIDVAQAVGHIPITFRTWDADFLVFSGHKLFGPTGVGILVGKEEALKKLSPVNVGGGTVLDVTTTPIHYKPGPERFEGGTPNIAGIIGLGAAIDFVERIGIKKIHEHESLLLNQLIQKLKEAFGGEVKILGSESKCVRTGLLSFTLEGLHPHDMASLLGEENICVRAGEHCATPLHRKFSLPATTRVSVSIYNDKKDIEKLVTALIAIEKKLSP